MPIGPAAPPQGSLLRHLNIPGHPRIMRILVVEDSMPVAGMIITAVQSAGHSVAGHSSSVEQSLQLLAECEFDVVILDVDLKGENSAPVAEELRRRNIPFLVVTGASHLLEDAHRDAPLVLKPLKLVRLLDTLSAMQREFID